MAEPATSTFWDDDRAARWLRQSAGIERQLTPVSEVLFAAADLRSDESVLDVGCGTGPTTRQAAVAVGPTGRVSGLDVSATLLAAASSVPPADGAAPIDWIEADPVTWSPPAARYDVVLSRFGVMFFSDPRAAFAALATAAHPGGRLAMATWAKRDESELFTVSFGAALATLGRHAADYPEEAPFSLHDPAAIAELLGATGWSDARTSRHLLTMPFGGGLPLAEAAEAALDFGPTRMVAADLDDADRARVVAAIGDAFTRHLDADGHVALDGTVLVTTAIHP